MAVQARFCGRCGGVLAPGAPFCGRCGTPVVAAPLPAYPAYSYPQAQAPAGRLGGGRATQVAVAGGLIAILIIVAVAVTVFAVRYAAGSHQPCTSNCGPKIVHPLPASATYRSSAFRYEVDYNQRWTVRNQDANGISLGTDLGIVTVSGMKAGQPLDQVIQGVVGALPSANWQNVTQVSDLKGAHIGNQNGLGSIFSANLLGANSTATKVRFAVIAAAKGDLTVVVFVADPADTSHFASGIPEGQMFDYMCSQFRWPS